jgi:ubiquinone/menaquinone biosynthesis C-methylase UbiE
MQFDTSEEYWDAVAEDNCPKDLNQVRMNFNKRPVIAKALLDYDFTGKTVLEVGAGFAVTIFALRQLYGGKFKYIGTDISEKFINATKRHLFLDIIKCNADHLPAEDGEVDFILALDVLEHIHPDERRAVAEEFSRVLRSRVGRVLINNPLAKTQHDTHFDFGMNDVQLAQFASDMGGTIERVTILKAARIFYQFVSIVKDGGA